MSEQNSPYSKRLLSSFMIVVMIALVFTAYKTNEIRNRAFGVYIDEGQIGVVRTEEEALNIVDEIEDKLSNTYSADCVINKDITFEATHARDSELTSSNNLKEAIESQIDFLVAGYTILVDEEEAGTVKTEEEAKQVIELVKSQYVDNIEGELGEIKILEEVRISENKVPLSYITTIEGLIQYINTGQDKIKTHTVEVGESLWTIALMYNMTVEDLSEANADMNPDKLQIGDEVKLVIPTSMVTVATTEKIEYNKDTDFETIVENDDSMYNNQQKIEVEGQRGQSHIVSNNIKHNGVLIEEKIISEDVIKEPIDKLIVKGTKEVPKTMATGAFMMPTRGRFTSGYGQRWGRMHQGIDIAATEGTPIYAADGGVVTHSGWQGSYGYMVEIDHENGYKTRYAHSSKLLVSKGTRVYKGQHIADVGNTGRSTGPHLHLEVLKNGVHVNPSKYVN